MLAFITGATSGIGEAYATKLAQQGYDLIITGRRMHMLNRIASRLINDYHINVETIKAELSADNELDNLVERIEQIDAIDILVNNAGFGSPYNFLEKNFTGQEKMIIVHIVAPLKLIYAALPRMIKRGHGVIINVSSVSGKTPLPTGATYGATKSFMQIFSESLYLENIDSNILIQTLCPGFTKTNFHDRIGGQNQYKNKGFIRWMTPEDVVEISLKNLKKGKVICVPGFWNNVLWILADIVPRNIYYKIISRMAKRELLFE
ncbi:MAG TPA: SDR family oxidoreductase [Bacteroidales bacterium]|nr:SDR family oxidoreductase [Bacteroidales bacterium]